jgi:hypothetical protein
MAVIKGHRLEQPIASRPVQGCAHGGRWMVDTTSHRVVRRPCEECERTTKMRIPTPDDDVPARAGIGRTVRLALFGATRPLRWLTDLLRGQAEELDPQQSDIRAFGPADLPEEVDISHGPGRHPSGQVGGVNPENPGRRPERG